MKRLLIAATALASLSYAGAAFAVPTIQAGACLGAACSGAATLTGTGVVTGFPGVAFLDAAVGAFTIQGSAHAGTTVAGAVFHSQSLTVSTTTGGVLDLYFTLSDVVRPGTGDVSFISSFTSNQQIASIGHSVTEQTWIDAGNGLYDAGKVTLLASSGLLTSAGPETIGPITTAIAAGLIGPGPLSITHMYEITLLGCGTDPNAECSANLTIDLNANPIPEPASMAVIGLGVLGLGIVHSRRKQ